ncbi:MAG: LysE family translocator [Elusimicrobia bacterium]|nr:LysE family translocator [Candidatus Liberimonas magnetica]
MIKASLLALVSFILGLFAAIPTGSVQVEVIKRALHDRIKPALAVIAGAFIADSFYGFVAFFGIVPLLMNKTVMGFFALASSLILAVLAFYTFRHANRIHIGDMQHFILRSKRVSFLIGLSLGAANPVIIFWWLLSAKLITDIGLYLSPHYSFTLIVVISGAMGLAFYLVLFAVIISWAKKFISNRFIKWINIFLGVFLACLAVYFFIDSMVKIF